MRTRSFRMLFYIIVVNFTVKAVWSQVVGLLVRVVVQLMFEAIWKESVIVSF